MTRTAYVVVWGTALCLGAGTHAAADPVTITSGSIVLSQPSRLQTGPIMIAGTRGFSIEGVVNTGEGSFAPVNQCFPCGPTTDFSVGATSGTFSISSTVTLDGSTYHDVNSFDSSNFVFLHLSGTTVLPPVNGSSLVIHAPFTVAPDAFFTYEVTPGSDSEPPQMATVALRGQGRATVSFYANPSAPVWEFNGLRYDFVATPEPATLVLIGGGLVATLLRFKPRRTRSSRPL
jgi:hypothetical protein